MKDQKNKKDKIIAYYNNCEIDYKILWNLRKSKALHYSFIDGKAKNFKEGLIRTNDKIIELCNINSKSNVLDAGCGIGGSSIYIGEKTGCNMTGITLVSKQAETANAFIRSKGLNNIKIETQDYTNTNFKGESFDVIFAIESVCYAANKADFLKEAYRLLKKDGKLVIFDFFQACNEEELNGKEKQMMSDWTSCWAIDKYETPINMVNNAIKIGFSNVDYNDVTKNVIYSSKKLNFWFFPAVPVDFIGRLFKVRNNITKGNVYSARYQYKALKKHLWEYGIFSAEKK